MPDITGMFHLDVPVDAEPGVPEMLETLDILQLLEWDDRITAPPHYDGMEISDAFAISFPLERDILSAPLSLEIPPQYIGLNIPYVVREHTMLTTQRPTSPIIPPPPRPDDFWGSLNYMQRQLSGFDIGAHLSHDVQSQVEGSILSYEQFLETLQADVSHLFDDNILLMDGVRDEYRFFLEGLRWDVLAAQFAEHEALQTTIDEFATVVEGTSQDTQNRLGTFASMMPISRTPTGINHDLVDFAVAPFEFMQIALQDEVINTHAFTASMADDYARYQQIALWVVTGVFTATLLGSFIALMWRKKKD